MDLAGLDIPSRTRVRTYATAASATAASSTSTSMTDEGVDYTPSGDAASVQDNETDKRIYMAIHHAIDTRRKDLVKQLISYYRSPRDLPPPSDLASHLPLPTGYTVNTYNACIHGLLATRSDGESIAPILEIYNEMLERNVVPNGRTYTDVIRALCFREKDVQTAVSRHGEESKWSDFRLKNLGLKKNTNTDKGEDENSEAIKSYLAEGNLDSAYRLFKGIASVQSNTAATGDNSENGATGSNVNDEGHFYRFYPHVYSYLLDAMSKQPRPNTTRAREVFDHSHSTSTAGRRMLYRHMFRIYAAAEDKQGLQSLWERFEAERADGEGTKMREWKDILPGIEVPEREVQVEGFQSTTYTSAIVSFIQVGQVDTALKILESMTKRLGSGERSVALSQPPRPTIETFGQVVIALARQGRPELSKEWYERALESMGRPPRPIDMAHYIDALVLEGQWQTAIDVYQPILSGQYEDVRPDHTRLKRIYSSLLGDARRAQSKEQVLEIIGNVRRFMTPQFPVLLESELAIQHIQLLLKHQQYTDIASVLDAFGPMRTRLAREDRFPLHRLLEQVAFSPIPLMELLDILRAFSRQKVQPTVDRPLLIQSILDRYAAIRTSSDATETLSQITEDGWGRLFSVVAKTTGPALDEGEYDTILEYLVGDLKQYAPNTLKADEEGRVVAALGARLFNRFGSQRATEMLTPLLGMEETEKVLSKFLDHSQSQSLFPSDSQGRADTPELVSDSPSASGSASASETPGTPPQRQARGGQGRQRKLVVSGDLSKLVDSHTDRHPQITPEAAYIEIRNAISKNLIPHPGSIGRLMTTLARQSASASASASNNTFDSNTTETESKILELYQLAQNFIQSDGAGTQAQSAYWRSIEDAMLISQCHLGHLEQAGLHRHRLVTNGTPPSADAYATMISSSKDTTDDATVARELFDESQMMGVRPHLYLYNTVISKLSKARKAEEALEMFAQMKAQGVRPSSVTYGAVIVSPFSLLLSA